MILKHACALALVGLLTSPPAFADDVAAELAAIGKQFPSWADDPRLAGRQ